MHSNDDIKDLLNRINYGDDTAYNELINLKSSYLQKLAYSYLKDAMLVEDVVSEVFYELVKKVGKFEDDRNLNGWLNVTAVNKSINLYKKRKKEFLVGDIARKSPAIYDNKTEKVHIKNCLAKLKDHEREVLLYVYYGNTLNEITKSMDLTINKVRGLIERAKAKFKKYYENK